MRRLLAVLAVLTSMAAMAQNGYGQPWVGPFDVYAIEICLPYTNCYYVPVGDVFTGTLAQGANNYVEIADTGGGYLQSPIEILGGPGQVGVVQEQGMTVQFGANFPIPDYGNCKFAFGNNASFTFAPANATFAPTVCGNEQQWVLGGSGGVTVSGTGCTAQTIPSGTSIYMYASAPTFLIDYACAADWNHTWATVAVAGNGLGAQPAPTFVGPWYSVGFQLTVHWANGAGHTNPGNEYYMEMGWTAQGISLNINPFGYSNLVIFDTPTSFTSAVAKKETGSGLAVPLSLLSVQPSPVFYRCPSVVNFVSSTDVTVTRKIGTYNFGQLEMLQNGWITGCKNTIGQSINVLAALAWSYTE